jgi:hypothetical protein
MIYLRPSVCERRSCQKTPMPESAGGTNEDDEGDRNEEPEMIDIGSTEGESVQLGAGDREEEDQAASDVWKLLYFDPYISYVFDSHIFISE